MAKLIVLFVDDDKADLFLYQRASSRCGTPHTMHTARTAKAALTLLDEGLKPDIIFTDLNMPVTHGFEFVEALRNRAGPTPAIHVISTSDDPKTRRQAYNMNVPFNTKPLTVNQLDEFLQELLSECPSI